MLLKDNSGLSKVLEFERYVDLIALYSVLFLSSIPHSVGVKTEGRDVTEEIL